MPMLSTFAAGSARGYRSAGIGGMVPATNELLLSAAATGTNLNTTAVCRIPLSAVPVGATEWQLELRGAGTGAVIGEIWFGETTNISGQDAWDFKPDPPPVLVNPGGQTFNLNSASPLTRTNEFFYTAAGGSPYMFSFNITTGGVVSYLDKGAGTGYASYFKAAVQQAGVVNKLTYGIWGNNRLALVNRLYRR